MSNYPKVSVIMPVFNAEKYVADALQSILLQTFTDFEFIIINDGSTDRSREIIEGLKDNRIVFIDGGHQGLAASLNKGLAESKGLYVARMDSDDISLPERFEKQVKFLDSHPRIGIIGSACHIINANGDSLGMQTWPVTPLHVRWRVLFTSPFAHPTVMMRRAILVDNKLWYRKEFEPADDYELWTQLLKFTDGCNLEESLLRYRKHESALTSKDRGIQLKHHDTTMISALQHELPTARIGPVQARLLRSIFVEQRRMQDNCPNTFLLYLNLFNSFLTQHSTSHELKVLRKQEAQNITLCLVRNISLHGWIPIIWKLFQLDGSIFWIVICLPITLLIRRMKRLSIFNALSVRGNRHE